MPDLSSPLAELGRSGAVTVFFVFLSPVSPGVVAGIVLAREAGLSAPVTVGLYVLSDVVAAIVLEPVLRRLRRWAETTPLGRRALGSFERVGSTTQIVTGRFGLPLGVLICSFATDFLTAAIISTGLRMSRLLAWTCIIAGDVGWFLLLFLASLGIATVLSDNRFLFVATLLLGFGLPYLTRRLFGPREEPGPAPPECPLRPRSQPTGAVAPSRSPSPEGWPREDHGATSRPDTTPSS